jgi:hypothetical protein
MPKVKDYRRRIVGVADHTRHQHGVSRRRLSTNSAREPVSNQRPTALCERMILERHQNEVSGDPE